MPVDRTRLPEPGPPLSCNFPEVRRRTLANGLRVCTIEHHEVPLVTCFVLMPIGSSQDPGHQPGLAAITGDLLDEGSGDLDALAVHEALGRIGAHLDTEIGADATLLELTTLEQYAPRALELLASMVWNPRLDPRDFDRVRELRLSRLVQLRDLPPAVADRVFTQLLYPEHPYGHLPIGTEEALRALTIADVTTFPSAMRRTIASPHSSPGPSAAGPARRASTRIWSTSPRSTPRRRRPAASSPCTAPAPRSPSCAWAISAWRAALPTITRCS